MSGYTPLEQWLYDTGVAMPGDVERIARKIEASDWLAARDAEFRAEGQQVLAWIDRTLALPMYQDEIGDYDEGVLMALKGVRKMLTGTTRPDASWRSVEPQGEPSDVDLTKLANDAHHAMVAEAETDGGWYGFSHARDAWQDGFETGYRARAAGGAL